MCEVSSRFAYSHIRIFAYSDIRTFAYSDICTFAHSDLSVDWQCSHILNNHINIFVNLYLNKKYRQLSYIEAKNMRLLLKELCNIFFRNFRLVLLTNSNSLHYDSQVFLSTYRGGGARPPWASRRGEYAYWSKIKNISFMMKCVNFVGPLYPFRRLAPL